MSFDSLTRIRKEATMFSMCDYSFFGFARMKCGLCKVEVALYDAEICWYCGGPLCDECWEQYGHCGHAEADLFDESTRKANEAARKANETGRK